jgi:hypothetical protein
MKRTVALLLVGVLAAPGLLGAESKTKAKKKKVPCAASLAQCGDAGCGTDFDANLNRKKNVTANAGVPEIRTLAWMKKLDDPEHFEKGGSRKELEGLGEGDMVTVAAYIIAAKAELSGESCNCGLQTPAETDNHLVLVTKTTVDKFQAATDKMTNTARFHSRELESITAEFTPRVRVDHPHFTREIVKPLIDKAKQKALLVRVTGPLLFDSEHFINHHLVRVNNWEIHPVLKFEYCQTGTNCAADSDTGWKSFDDMSQPNTNQ